MMMPALAKDCRCSQIMASLVPFLTLIASLSDDKTK